MRRPKTKEWLAEQVRTIGSSTAPKVLGKSKFGSPRQVAELMLGQREPPDLSQNKDVRRGIILEPIGRQLVQEATGQRVQLHPQDKFVYNRVFPFAHALPDAWMDGKSVQIKWPRPAKFQEMRMAGLNEEYMISAQHELAITAQDQMWCAVGCCITMDILLVPIKYDEKFVTEMMLTEQEFAENIQKGILPAEDAKPREIEVPTTPGKMRYVSTKEAVAIAKAHLEASQLAAEAKELADNARDRLKIIADIGHAFEIQDGQDSLVRCHRIAMGGKTIFDHEKAVRDDPELKRYYRTGDPYEVFRVYDMRRNT